MKYSRSNRFFWACIALGTLGVTIQSVLLFGPMGAPLGIGSGASLGAVVFYLGEMLFSALRWLRQQLQRS